MTDDSRAERLADVARGVVELPDDLSDAERDDLIGVRAVAGRLGRLDPDDLVAPEPPADLLDRIRSSALDDGLDRNASDAAPDTTASTSEDPRRSKGRLAPSFIGRWTPALVAAGLIIAVLLSVVVGRDDDPDFIAMDLAAQGDRDVVGEFRVIPLDGGTDFELRADGIAEERYDVWVRTDAGERVWIGSFEGDPRGTLRFSSAVEVADIERFWVTDPDDTPILGHDI